MVFSPLHWIPSTLAALIILSFAFTPNRRHHKALGAATVLLALLGLAGYISAGSFRFFPIDLHTFHVWVGFFALALTIFLFADKIFLQAIDPGKHCRLGKLAALLAAVALVVGMLMLSGLAPSPASSTSSANGTQEPTSSNLSEVEAAEYRGTELLPLKQLLEIRKLRQELRHQGVPVKAMSDIEKYTNNKMEIGIDKIASEVVNESQEERQGEEVRTDQCSQNLSQ